MALITRVSRLLRADVNAVLDRLEEPDLLLRQAIRDMDEAVQELKVRLNAKRAEHAHLARRNEDLDARHGIMSEQLDAALAAGNEIVARTVVRRRLENRAEHDAVNARMQLLAEKISRLGETLVSDQDELARLRQQADLFVVPHECAGDDFQGEPGRGHVTEDEVEAALLREMDLRTRS